MADTPKRLFGPAVLSAAAATKYTVPGATTTVIRHIHVLVTDGAAHTFTMSIGADAVGTRLYSAQPLSPDLPFDWNGFIVAAAAEIIQAYADAASGVTIEVDGVEIT